LSGFSPIPDKIRPRPLAALVLAPGSDRDLNRLSFAAITLFADRR
jgi:hypothetical protein